MEFALFDFVLASLLMGLGIGSDVAIATFARANQLAGIRTALIWIVGVSVTHTVFPMLGYLLTYFSLQLQPNIEPIVGLIAFAFIFFYLKGELADFIRSKDGSQNDDHDRQILVTLGLILAVSWDALWSGPAKSAQVIGWPELFVWLSFIVVGIFVSTLAIVSLSCALRVKKVVKHKVSSRWFAFWLQYTVVGYFGLLALFNYTLGLQLTWWQTLMTSGVVIALFMSQTFQKLSFRQIEI
ncbi:hypothetical protein L0668_01690 [Paraglaciecola aquimarina]|uniref:Manganese efflux pump MntP n=1 Tax=Paraglaciecola algarum TaxID=3050085 RepID=A0ABS9D1K7_9ALTE|nr:hypothetical protein [Paraglaciecola sp. G1-23]MCF2946803.1 hypothetical protein [Paraglaciecola sp. G1-23]